MSHSITMLGTMLGTIETMKMMKRLGVAAMLATLALGAAGCADDYDHTEISAVVPAKLQSDMDVQQLHVPEGMIIKAHIVVYNDDNEAMPLEIRSSDKDIVEVASVISDRDYAFIGKRAGHTQVQFIADGKPVVTIEADVTPQPAIPTFQK